MNLIYDRYPNSVMLNGKHREIVTDFKDWLRFVDLLKDDEYGPEEKFESILLFLSRKLRKSAKIVYNGLEIKNHITKERM